MKRNGLEQLPTNGQVRLAILARSGERRVGNHDESHPTQKVEHSIAYMLQHLNEPLQVATLAAVVNVSPSHYSALFKRWTGCPPIDYFIHLRMQRACELFDGTSLNVKEVAAALGYDDPFYFSRTFKSVNRIAPSEYRMMSRELRDTVKNAALPLPFSTVPEARIVQEMRAGQEPVNGHAGPRWKESLTPLSALEP